MLSTELVYLPAVEALRLFRSRELSPAELMMAVIERAEAVEPRINAFAERMFEEALDQAREAEARYARRGASPRALEGLPVAVKEEMPISGRTLTEGSLLYQGNISDVTHPIVERILTAGGIVHARTTTPEFSCAGFTHSKLWGVTRNPWNLDYTPGGSSGGSGAALAAGTAALATGSDIGGSIRIPASFSGVVGYKPPYGRVPALPPWNLDHYCHGGPMARTVADCALLENVIAGPHPVDAVSLRPAVRIPDELAGIDGWKIAVSITLGDYPVEPEVASNTLSTAEALRHAGATVEEVELKWNREDIDRASMAHYGAIFGAAIGYEAKENPELLMPYTKAFIEDTIQASKETNYLEGLEIEGRLYAELGPILERYDGMICPTVAVTGLLAGEDYVNTRIEVDDVSLDGYFGTLMTIPFNIASRCPVLSVPSGITGGGLPTGVQIVGPTYSDESVFRVAAALEKVRPWFGDPAWRPPL